MFHVHKWSDWKSVTYNVKRLYRGQVYNGISEEQQRTCTKCGLTRSRVL
jgi:hypothetical protein